MSEANAQNPVDRQVGEADLLWLRETFDSLSFCTEGEFACSASERDAYEADRNRAAAIIADLQQVTRERDEAVEHLRTLFEDGPFQLHLGGNPRAIDTFVDSVQTFLASLRSMEKTGG